MSDKKQIAIIVLLCVNLIVLFNLGRPLQNRLEQQNHHLAGIQGQINNLENNIYQQVRSMLDSQNNFVLKTGYTYEAIDSNAKKAVLQYTAEFKSVSPNATVCMAIKQDGKQLEEIELVKASGLSFAGTLELRLDKNYTYNLIERTEGGGETLLNTHPQYLSLYDEFYQNRIQPHSSSGSWSYHIIEKQIQFSIADFGLEGFGLENVILEVWYEGALLNRANVTEDILYMENPEASAHYNVALASGQISSSTSYEQFVTNEGAAYQGNQTGQRLYSYTISLQPSEYEVFKTQIKGELLEMRLYITCKDGFVSELSF